MKRLTAILSSLLLLCLPAKGQDARVERIRQFLSEGRVTLEYSYAFQGDFPLNGNGTLVLQGNCYCSSGNGIVIICDGTTRWTMDSDSKEVYIENAGGTEDFLANPAVYLSAVEDAKVGTDSVSGTFVDPEKGSRCKFSLKNIRKQDAEGQDIHPFTVDVSSLGKDWVVTDLR